MKKKSAYFVGIKGVAMTALAVYFKEKGYDVTGSDVDEVFATDKILAEHGIKIKKGFDSKNIDRLYDYVIVTGAHGGMTNKEAQYAKDKGLLTLMHGQAIGMIMEGHIGVSVSGCHGKTSTSSLMAMLLKQAGLDPSYAIGTADINGLGAAGHYGKGNIFIAEADEYMTCPKTCITPRFLWQKPKVLIITNIEFDHPDAFDSIESTKQAFLDLTEKVVKDGVVIACIDNQHVREIIKKITKEVITYGFTPNADFIIENFSFSEGVSFMRISHKNIDFGEFTLHIPGRHNLLNALGASIAANFLGISWERLRQDLKLYTGCNRRFEKIGERGGILLYDDYAHHPSEIKATLASFRDWFPQKRLIVVFQPHTFSRTKALLPEFAKAFIKADIAIVTDIYPSARESYDSTISALNVVTEINRIRNNAVYKKDKHETFNYLMDIIKKDDLIVTMGAGSIYTWRDNLLELLKKNHE